MSDDLPNFEKGRMVMNTGDLMDVTDFDFEFKDDGKVLHTLRASPAGFVQGNIEASGSFNFLCHPDGPEFDWIKTIAKNVVKQLRFKFSGLTIAIIVKMNSLKITAKTDDAIQGTISWVGMMSR